MKLTKEWTRLAGLYESAVNAVHADDYDSSVSGAEYGALVDARERAYAALAAESRRKEVRA